MPAAPRRDGLRSCRPMQSFQILLSYKQQIASFSPAPTNSPTLNPLSGQNPRQIAARVLGHWRTSREFIEVLLERALHGAARATRQSADLRSGAPDTFRLKRAGSKTGAPIERTKSSPHERPHEILSPADRGLCQELVLGVVRWQATLDWLITRKTQGRTQKGALQDLLRLGLYQIFWLDRIPDHAAVHETVELGKHARFGPQAGFVNAVLRGYLREADATKKLLADLKTQQPALGHSHPEWLYDRWNSRWGAERAADLLAWNNTPPKTYA